jgi:thioesterase domain-containing protein
MTLRAEGTLPALFVLHPAGGGVTCYQHLVAGLPLGPRVRAYRSVVGADERPGSFVEPAPERAARTLMRRPL